ncbi:Feline leukemia virus subgroup C receptor-related protein 1 [Porphyridium purpureum]|uniref:Feline leukemia virus subgroup C receptor-related protein 1 n=1 Tax=Porphyridium purpureum TaxID=35688 RepID=A0A5J4YXB9_PORPP|nr:Feline leukemia virus subgroup C receptor-related protein 1 [Porphyridium purpureum]|eukprot:POR0832..scf209_3
MSGKPSSPSSPDALLRSQDGGTAVAPDRPPCRLYTRRWLMLAIFSCCLAQNQAPWGMYSSIYDHTMQFYALDSSFYVLMLSLVYLLVYVVGCFPGAYMTASSDMRFALLASQLLNTLGNILKYLSTTSSHSYWLLFWGQLCFPLAECLLFCMPARLSSLWFGAHERASASAVSWASCSLGIALTFLLVPRALESMGMHRMMLVILISNIVLLAVVAIAFAPEPLSPPSDTTVFRHRSDFSMRRFAKEMAASIWETRAMTGLIMSYGISTGIMYSVTSNLQPTFGIVDGLLSTKQLGDLGFALVLAGMVGLLLMGPCLDWSKKFWGCHLTLANGSFLGLLGTTLFLQFSSRVGASVALVLFGCCTTAMTTTGLEYAVELTYPLSEEVSSTSVMFSAQLFGTLAMFLSAFIIRSDVAGPQMQDAMWIFSAINGVALLIFYYSDGICWRSVSQSHPHLRTRIQSAISADGDSELQHVRHTSSM